MGFVDKLKNLFTEEDEEMEEVPVKKEVIHVDIPAPVKQKEEVKEEVKEEEEEKFKFPVYFDDKDFDELKPAPAVEPKREVRETRETRSKEIYQEKKPYQGNVKTSPVSMAKKKKTFAPSPIISPVYGVLDKNYHKEEIVDRAEVNKTPIIAHTNTKATIDDVRNKAYGTLEDDLETTLFGKNSILFNEKEEKKETEDFFDDLGFGLDEEEVSPLPEEPDFEKNSDMTLEDMDNLVNNVENELDDNHEELKEDDLFDLIDSMYEKREDNE